MTSTEQKNASQPFIDSCFTFGIYPTLIANGTTRPFLETGKPPFSDLGKSSRLGERVRRAEDPASEAITLFPTLSHAPLFTRLSLFILRLASDSRVYVGNQGVLKLAEGIISNRWNLHFRTTDAIKHARRQTPRVCSFLAPASYGNVSRSASNCARIGRCKQYVALRNAADTFDHLSRTRNNRYYQSKVRRWCATSRGDLNFRTTYRSAVQAKLDYDNLDVDQIANLEAPPSIKQKAISTAKRNIVQCLLYRAGSHFYVKITNRHKRDVETRLTRYNRTKKRHVAPKEAKCDSELIILSPRDMKDLVFLLQAASQVRLYMSRRLNDVKGHAARRKLHEIQEGMWSLYMSVMSACSGDYELRNKLGVYFDVLQWRYLAHKSGDVFYDHSSIMRQKIKSKGLTGLPSQDGILARLKNVPMDIAVDMLGIYKASLYPEVDPFKVISDQYTLHHERHQTDWQPGSPEYERFMDTKAYMWYLGGRVLYSRFGIWSGKIREGVEAKDWHADYKRHGVPSDNWRDAHDVDLTGAVIVTEATNEQYMKQQDSACAPPLWEEYANFEALQKAPRRHRRKLLYAIQEKDIIDIPSIFDELNEIGRQLPDGYVDHIDYRPSFSTDIVTGSRCERHKDAPRPFYAASPPWGCTMSYIDGITRDFLKHVPQSMLGKSTRQKYLDLSTTARSEGLTDYTFYMSDDKAKYSPHMDPQSQQMPSDFFAEVFNIPAIKAVGPVMYHNKLFYRVHGHLVSYGSNGTDREGMRGAANTWLEVVAQGLSTRLCREKGLVSGKSIFLSFIDDGLRKFTINSHRKSGDECYRMARLVIDDVIFGLRVLGRELSWDKTFISRSLFVILNELVFDGSFVSSGLKSFCTAGDLEMKEVMSAPDYEQLYFGKMRGAHGVGAPLDMCHYVYVFETTLQHYRMGIELQDNKQVVDFDYRMFCITPVALGGAGVRSMLQLGCNEVANATKEGIGNLLRLTNDYRGITPCVMNVLNQPLEELSPIDFMREPEQFHVGGPRLKTQRLAAEVRKQLAGIANNDMSKKYIEQDKIGMNILQSLGKLYMNTGDVSAEEIRLMYATTPVAFIDEFVQKLASSVTLAELLPRSVIKAMRRIVRRDLICALQYFPKRSQSKAVFDEINSGFSAVLSVNDLVAR